MKAVLLAFAVVLVCAVYEVDREWRLVRHPALTPAFAVLPEADGSGAWDGAPALPDWHPLPHPAGSRERPAGQVEHEHSIRLFGPGVDRRQQIRV